MSDELVWSQRSPGEPNWRARNAAGTGTYIVHVSDTFGVGRIEGGFNPDDPPGVMSTTTTLYLSISGVGSVAEAKDACQEHHYTACRSRRWFEYMRDNEPPIHPIPPGPCGDAGMSFMGSQRYHCELLSGHAGWHRDGECSWGATGITEEGLA